MKRILMCLMAAVLTPAILAAQTDPKSRPPTIPPGPAVTTQPPMGHVRITNRAHVGEAAPGFELEAAGGQRTKLSQYHGTRVMLAFADRGQALAAFGATAESLRVAGVRLVGVCRESPRRLHTLAERETLRFELLSDPTGEVAAIYGAYDFTTSTTQPGYVLVGKKGTVRMVLLGQALPPAHLLQITRYALTGLEGTP